MPTNSEKAQHIINERPRFWEHKYFAQVLRDDLAKHASLRTEHRRGVVSGKKIQVRKDEFAQILVEHLETHAENIGKAEKTLQFLSELSFGPTGTGKDEFFMAGLAEELAKAHLMALEWSQYWRRLDLKGIFRPFLSEAAINAETFLASVESLPDNLELQLAEMESKPVGMFFEIRLLVNWEPHNSEAFERESERLRRKLDS